MNASVDLDIGPLSWVKGEIDLALERAGTELVAHGAAAPADPAGPHLAAARASLHQAHGALAIVGLDGLIEFAEAIEQLLAALADAAPDAAPDAVPPAPTFASAAAAAQDGIAALRGYLDDLMAGHPNQPLKLYAAYRALIEARGQSAPGPAALFFPDLTQRPPKREKDIAPLVGEALTARLKAARLGFERGLLKWIKHDPKGIAEMRLALAMIEATREAPAARAYWWISLGVLDALAADGLPDAAEAKRFALRLGAQIKKLGEGQAEVPAHALRDALYLAASATHGGEALNIVRAAYRLDGLLPGATPSDAERLQPHLRRLRELLAAAKDDWNRLCAGTAAALPPFHERSAKIAEEGAATGQPAYARLTAALLAQTDLLRRDPSRHTDALALEMATALLLAESALDNFEALDAGGPADHGFTDAVAAVVARLDAVSRGEDPGELRLPQLDAISRRAQERLLLESVAREIRTNLGAIEQTLDAYFRDPSRQHTLAAVQDPLRQIDGALAVLGQERARAVLAECDQAIRRFAAPGVAPAQGEFEDVAKKLSALGFFVAQLQHGHADIDAILAPAPQTTTVVAAPTSDIDASDAAGVPPAPTFAGDGTGEMGNAAAAPPAPTTLAAPATPATDAAAGAAEAAEFVIPGMAEAVAAGAAPTRTVVGPPLPSAEAARLVHASAEEIDAEMLGIFLEEAREVLAAIAEHLPRLHAAPDDAATLPHLRRAFHTLKGSGRMVKLGELGETAWAVEQVLNRWLHEARAATPALLDLLDLAFDTFSAWVAQLDAGGSAHYADAGDLLRRCAALDRAPADTAADTASSAAAADETVTDTRAEVPSEAPPEVPTEIPAEMPTEGPAHAAVDATEAALADASSDARSARPTDLSPAGEPLSDLSAAAPSAASSTTPSAVPSDTDAGTPPPEAARAEVVAFPAPPPVRVGTVELAPTLYNLYLEETRGHIATLQARLGSEDVPGQEAIRAAHTTASISAATGFMSIHHLAHALEAALLRLAQVDAAPSDAQRFVFARCAGALEGMLGAVAERRLPGEEAELSGELDAMQPALDAAAALTGEVAAPAEATDTTEPLDAGLAAATATDAPAPPPSLASAAPPVIPLPTRRPRADLAPADRRARRMGDEIDAQLLPLFLEESIDLLRQIGKTLRAWRNAPTDSAIAPVLQRALHTLKGSARMAGAMGCGELLHSMETRVEQAGLAHTVTPAIIESLETSYDRTAALIEELRHWPTQGAAEAPAAHATTHETTHETADGATDDATHPATFDAAHAGAPAHAASAADAGAAFTAVAPAPTFAAPAAQGQLRVRAELVDELVNEAGEIAIARARVESEMLAIKASLLDLTENVIRLRGQLREVEIQAEARMQSQMAEHAQEFDPLEFDRFTRFQEVTRMMAESVNDVTTVQHNLLKNLDHANAALAAQGRLNRELSQRLMSVRMVPFDSIAERLHRVVRQAAKDAGKRANLDIRQGQTELDRSVLDRMAGALEHMLRNSVAHGIEEPAARAAAGKPAIGQITLALAQEGNEIVITLSDDGNGLDLERIRQRAVASGLLAADAAMDTTDAADAAANARTLSALIFQSGFSTAPALSQLAGRGIGMDVVKNEAGSLGGRVEVSSVAGQGATFRVYLPLTLAVTQAVLVSVGNRRYAIPSSMVEQASELKPDAIAQVRAAGGSDWLGQHYPWRYLPALLGEAGAAPSALRRHWLLLVKGGSERVALEVDGLLGNQEIVVKAIGPQLARVAGVAGATVLADGDVALILNPIALLARAGEHGAIATSAGAATSANAAAQESTPRATSVMIVDDSLTVRKISGRLLARHGYEVITAKDGVDALERLGETLPDAMLVDIEMPRMDGFDLTRNIRADARLRHIPIVMITSRSADKHRQHALEIGVDDFLGKPYDEDVLLARLAELTHKKGSA